MIILKTLFIYFIRAYQVTPFHSHSCCRFLPSCSEYTILAINEYGLLKGIKLGIKGILKCHPFGKFGYDPLVKKGN